MSKITEDFDSNYDLFVTDAIATGCVWGLENAEGWALCSSNDNEAIDILPLWSQPEFAQAQCIGEWQDYQVIPISLEELLDDWLPGLHEDLLLVGPNWTPSLEGLEVEPLDMLEEFDAAIE